MVRESLSSDALTTVERVLETLNVEDSSRTRNLIIRLINSCSDFVKRRTGREFKLQQVTENVSGFGTTRLVLSLTPIKSLVKIEYNGSEIDISDVTIDEPEGGLLQSEGGFYWTAHHDGSTIEPTPLPGTERKLYAVEYVGGYVLPSQDGDPNPPVSGASRDLPYDLEEACIEMIRTRWNMLGRDPSMKSEKISKWSATYRDSMIPNGVLTVLNSYTRFE